jgi:hypothetical protein
VGLDDGDDDDLEQARALGPALGVDDLGDRERVGRDHDRIELREPDRRHRVGERDYPRSAGGRLPKELANPACPLTVRPHRGAPARAPDAPDERVCRHPDPQDVAHIGGRLQKRVVAGVEPVEGAPDADDALAADHERAP